MKGFPQDQLLVVHEKRQDAMPPTTQTMASSTQEKRGSYHMSRKSIAAV
jgi:hypothetical protein